MLVLNTIFASIGLISLLPELAQSFGSKTFLTNDGFPINFLESISQSPVVNKKLKSRWKWEVWDIVPGIHAYQIYVFNITNPKEVESGGAPNLQQLGPYYYTERRVKFDVSVNLDLSVNFERNYTYTFDPTKSNGTEDDLVNVLNLPLIIFSSIAAEVDAAKANAAVKALTSTGESLVRKGVKVGDFLYHGVDISNYKKYTILLGPKDDLVEEFMGGRYGVLKLKDGPHEKPYVVDSGLKDEKKVGQIIEWNEKAQLDWWSGDRCNMINGSDGSVFPPYLSRSKKLNMFDLDLCRSISFEYSTEMTFKGVVTGLQYNIANDTMEDPTVYQPNMCFCKAPNSCLKKGLLDVSKCRNGAPFVMSYAHFYNANPEYLKNITGLNPNSVLHQTQIDIEPVTGSVINFRKRYQWNIQLKPLSQIDYFKNTPSIIFPVIWNDDVFHLNPDKAQLLVEELANQMGGLGDVASDLLNRIDYRSGCGPSPSNICFKQWHMVQILFLLLTSTFYTRSF